MLVSDLKARMDGVQERVIETNLGQMSVDEDASFLTIAATSDTRPERFALDESVERAFGKYLGIPKGYLDKCPDDLKAHNLNYWFAKQSNRSAVIETVDEHFVTVHKPGLVIIPLRRVVDVIGATLDPSYEIVNLNRDSTTFQVDVITDHKVEVAPWEALEDRNPLHHATVGDITHGGIRFRASPTEAEEPVISTYLHRLWCLNGATSPEAESKIKLKGNTVDDVIEEMEAAMRSVVADLDDKLAQYAALATQYPSGDRNLFVRRVGEEFKLGARVLKKILDRVQLLPEGASLYDIVQVFTATANEEGLPYKTVLKLQEIGGTLAFDTEMVTHRCGACQTVLP